MSATTTTIDKLQVEIQSNSNSAAKGLERLTSSLQKLQGIGSFDKTISNLTSLNNSLANLKKLKIGSIGTLINSLGKLDSVTKGLTPETIGNFTSRVNELVESLRPLSDQMTSINQGFKNINSTIKTATATMDNANGEINATTLNYSSLVTVIGAVVSVLQRAVVGFTNLVDEAIQWDGIAERFNRGFGDQARKTYDWIMKLNDAMGLNVQQFMQYSSIYATMLKGFGVAHEDAGKMALGYTELTYDIWAGYNDVYKTFGEAADAVKSAIAGEVEPIRRAGFTIVESTLEQTAANHGLAVSIETATEAQKSYLRYLSLVDAARDQGLVGTYAREMDNAEGVMRTFAQQLKSLTQAFGSLFLPVLVRVMPWLQAFVELLTEGIRAIASFFGVEIQKMNWTNYNTGVSGASDAMGELADSTGKAAKAAKDLKKATLGIDELNIISPPTEGASGSKGVGGAGGFKSADVDSLWDESIFDQIQSNVKELKEKLKKILPIVLAIGTAFTGWSLFKGLKGLGFKEAIKSLFKGDWIGKASTAIKDGLKAAFLAIKGSTVGQWISGILTGAAGFLATIPTWVFAVVGAIVAAIALAIVDYDFTEVGRKIGEAIGKAFKFLGEVASWIVDVGSWILDGIGAAIQWAYDNFAPKDVTELAEMIITPFSYFGERFLKIGEEIWPSIWQGIRDGASNLWGNITEFCNGVLIGFLEGLGCTEEQATWFVGLGGNLIEGLWIGIDNWFTTLIENVSGFIDDTITEVKNFFGISDGTSSKFMEIGSNLIQGVIDGIKGMGGTLWGALSGWATGVINSVKGFFGIHSPSKVMEEEVGEFLLEGMVKPFKDGIDTFLSPIKDMWKEVKKWWDDNVKFTIPSLSLKVSYSEPVGVVRKAVVEALGLEGWPSLKFAANGGMFDMGSLIWAGERGAEVVANASGGKTGVMNVEQMQAAVYEGVYAAMMATSGSSGNGTGEIHVYLDGREISASIEQRQKERGASIMGTQVYKYG